MTFEFALFVLHAIPSLILLSYALNLYVLMLLRLLRLRRGREEAASLMQTYRETVGEDGLPGVVTQVPVYNESTVAERILRAVAGMSYPAGRHRIQVLDDSTDDTSAIIDRVAAELREQGARIDVVRREQRTGYKAGALADGLTRCDEPFIAIFDADFLPPADYLMRTVPLLAADPGIGLVQARWGHLNREASMLTEANAMVLDGHFTVDQPARAFNGLFMNFNGTAGVWRRQAIEAAGGWQADTLTEDLDLSYRAQLAGWRLFYLADLVVPAEIPENMNALKAQQFRWAKGSIQTARKVLPAVFRSGASPLAKIQAFYQMTGYAVHPLMLMVALMSLPYSMFVTHYSYTLLQPVPTLFLLASMAPYLIYGMPQVFLYRQGWRKLAYLPVVTLFGIGIAVSNTRAVWEALRGKASAFVRTPKAGAARQKVYAGGVSRATAVELLAAVYCGLAADYYLDVHKFGAVPYMVLCALGFGITGWLSLRHALRDGSLRECWLRHGT